MELETQISLLGLLGWKQSKIEGFTHWLCTPDSNPNLCAVRPDAWPKLDTLDAMHELEMKLDDYQKGVFATRLVNICCRDSDYKEQRESFVGFATVGQHLEALKYTLGLNLYGA